MSDRPTDFEQAQQTSPARRHYVVAAESDATGRTTVRVRDQTFVVDAPDADGGDAGALAVEHLLAALAGCINGLGHVVAAELGLTLERLAVSAEGDVNTAGFYGWESATRLGFERVHARIEVESDADDATLTEWLAQVEARNPVVDNLTARTPVDLTMARFER